MNPTEYLGKVLKLGGECSASDVESAFIDRAKAELAALRQWANWCEALAWATSYGYDLIRLVDADHNQTWILEGLTPAWIGCSIRCIPPFNQEAFETIEREREKL